MATSNSRAFKYILYEVLIHSLRYRDKTRVEKCACITLLSLVTRFDELIHVSDD